MSITENSLIGEVVAKDYRTAAVFRQHGIDFCCQGNRSIREACESEDIESSILLKELKLAVQQEGSGDEDYDLWPLDKLADHIHKKHHRYVEEKLPEIKAYLAKIVQVHGSKHPELAEISKLFSQSAGELAVHMKKEELVLFPFIRKMVKAKQEGIQMQAPHFGTVENPVAMMKHEHDAEGERFRMIAELSSNYTPPPDACNTYRVTYALLKEFEQDLHLHIHLENNILFPKAIELEKDFREEIV